MTKHWTTALDLMGDVLKHSTFPEHELQRVKREYLTDLRRGKDEPTVVADNIMAGLAFGRDTAYGHPMAGTEEAVSAFTRDDVQRQFRREYLPQEATLIVVGDVSVDEVVSQAETILGDWVSLSEPQSVAAAEQACAPDPSTIFLVDRPGAAQSVIRAVHPTIPRSDADYFGFTLLNYSFGGQFSARLNQNLRQDKGYSYGYNSSIHWSRGPSLLMAGGSVQTEVTKESVQETLQEFNGLRGSRPITQEELDASKAGLLLGYPASFERPGLVLNHLLQLVLFDLPNDYFQTMPPQLEGVSLDDIHRISSQRIDVEGLQILVVGDRETVEPGLRELGLPLVILDTDGQVI